MRDLFEDQIAIIEDRITVFMLSRRAYCHRGVLKRKGKEILLSLCRALWRILRAKMENLAG